ncbi:MAG: hypothetical protein ACE5D4_02660 [Thermodesulfobacteriota bacterium]
MKSRAVHLAVIVMGIILPLLNSTTALAGRGDQAATVAAEVSAFANLLDKRPQTAIDLSGVSGAYCFQVNLGKGGHMTHYAIDPAKSKEDVIDFVNAAPLIEAGLDPKKLPRHSGTLGTMEPNQWYYLPKGEFEPHHGVRFPFPVLIKAVDIK